MKKFLLIFSTIFLILIASIYSIFFTSFGNNIVKNIVEKKLNESLNLAVNIKEFKLGISKLSLDVLINGILEAKLDGGFSLLSQNMDLNYLIEGKNLEILKITDPLNVAGKIAGKFSDFNIDGKGVIFTSPLTLDASIKDYFPTKLSLNANNLDIEKLSKIAGVDYASGFINLNANVDEFDKNNLDVKALINLYSELKLKPSITKDFGIDVSRFGKVIVDSKNTYKANEITPNISISSNILNVSSKFEPININNLDIKGQIITILSELAFINPNLNSDLKITSNIEKKGNITEINSTINGKNINANNLKITHDIAKSTTTINTDLRANAAFLRLSGGELAKLNANANLDKNGLKNAKASGNILGGNANINLANNNLTADIKGLKSLALLSLANQDKMLDANIDINVKLSDLTKLVGNANLEINGRTVPSYFKSAYDLDINSKVLANIDAKLNTADNISFNAKINSDLVDNFNANGTYKKGVLNANYDANAKLANFNSLLNKKMSGDIKVSGNLIFDKIINLTLNSKEFFGGSLDAKLVGDKFNAKLNSVMLESLAKSFDFIDIYRANVSGDLNYNLKSASGKLVANVGQGHLKPNKSIQLLNAVLNTDITKIVFDKGLANVNINKNLIDYNANLLAKNAKVDITNGTYNTLSKAINAPIFVMFNNNEIKGKFVGTSDNVKYQPDAKNTVENAVKVLDKLTGKDNSKKLEKALKPAENLLKGLFKK